MFVQRLQHTSRIIFKKQKISSVFNTHMIFTKVMLYPHSCSAWEMQMIRMTTYTAFGEKKQLRNQQDILGMWITNCRSVYMLFQFKVSKTPETYWGRLQANSKRIRGKTKNNRLLLSPKLALRDKKSGAKTCSLLNGHLRLIPKPSQS